MVSSGMDSPPAQRPTLSSRVVRDGIALGAAVGIVGVVFGVLARATGLSVAKTCAMSLLVFTGASQFAAVGVIGSGGSPLAALGSALLLASRNMLYGPVVAQWFVGDSVRTRSLVAQITIDESTGLGAAQAAPVDRRLGFLAGGVATYVLWNTGTLIGALAGELIGNLESWGLDAAFPTVYVALLAPHLATRPGRLSALVAAAIALAAVPVLPVGVPILVSTIGAVVGAVSAHRAADAHPTDDDRGGQPNAEDEDGST